MTLEEAQKAVDEWIHKYGVYQINDGFPSDNPELYPAFSADVWHR